MATLTRASSEWANRPDDERFATVQELHNAVQADRDRSREAPPVPRRSVALAVVDGAPTWNGARFTNWSFSQLSGLVGAPAGYLRSLPTELAVRNLEHGISKAAEKEMAVAYVRAGNGGPPILRAVNSEKYARVYNADLTPGLVRIADRGWINPPGWDHERRPSGLYYGDRSMFVFMIQDADRSIVTHPNATQKEELGRGFMLWNSEEGGTSWGMETFWFRFVCGNHMIWGAEKVRKISFRHVGAVRRRIQAGFQKGIGMAQADRSASLDGFRVAMSQKFPGAESIKLLTSHKEDETLAELGKVVAGYTRGRVTVPAAVRAAKKVMEEEPGLDPRTPWGMAQGFTYLGRERKNADTRTDLDRMAALVMPKPARA